MASTIMFTQSINKSESKSFDKKYIQLVRFAEKKGLKKPKKGDLLSKIIKDGVTEITPDTFFN